MTAWYEENTFWMRTADLLFSKAHWERAPAEVARMVDLLKLEQPAHVLDIPCGPGRHSIELAQLGFGVTGVDLTAAYLENARQLADNYKTEIELVQADMRAFVRDEAFDVVINMYTSFGYFEDPEDDNRVLENWFRCLKKGGLLLIDLMGKEVLARILTPNRWKEYNNKIIIEKPSITQNWGWVQNEWIIIDESGTHTFNLGHRLYSAVELIGAVEKVGFRSVEVFGGLSGVPYDDKAERLVLVATK